MKKFLSLTILFFWSLASCAPKTPSFNAEALPGMNKLFTRESGWTGADAIESIPLSSGRILWLFGDSFFSDIRNGQRTCTLCFAHNSIAIQQKDSVVFAFGPIQSGQPSAFFPPPDSQGWFWPGHGIRTEKGLVVFLWQFVQDKDPQYIFGRPVATWQALISNPDEAPANWKVSFQKLPWFERIDGSIELLGTSVLQDGNWIYVYGFTEAIQAAWPTRWMLMGRVPTNGMSQFDEWEFYSKGQWQKDAIHTDLGIVIAPDYSVSRVPALGEYAAIYTEAGLSSKILMRLSPSPLGPWGDPQVIYHCPETDQDPKVYCYAARAHPELSSGPNDLIITYATNTSKDVSDSRYYFPRFVRIQISD